MGLAGGGAGEACGEMKELPVFDGGSSQLAVLLQRA